MAKRSFDLQHTWYYMIDYLMQVWEYSVVQLECYFCHS